MVYIQKYTMSGLKKLRFAFSLFSILSCPDLDGFKNKNIIDRTLLI